jgi:predicted kinase
LATPSIVEIARRHSVAPAAVALAALLSAHPQVIPIPGARDPESARQLATAATLTLDEAEREALSLDFATVRERVVVPASAANGELVLVMGLTGAGKSTVAQGFVADGYERLNRDERGGSLSGIATLLAERLDAGARRLVADNTYVTRAQRAQMLAVAERRGAVVRGIWLDISIADAQVNLAGRMLDAHGRLLEPDELRNSRDNTKIAPTALFRMQRAVEPPVESEGFSSLEVRRFVRTPRAHGRPARFVTIDLADLLPPEELREAFVIGWAPDAPPELEARLAARCRAIALCRHGGGPPACWCRPPLPGLLLALARAHDLDLASSELHGTSRAHRELAAATGARFVERNAS